ncbi:hypothetical protein [Sulfitobacter sp.]|uniref:hypothetical protein n=1 Tax=Sulfitobacter sp. TaxID=1903071 RepID=UPI0032996796
MANNPTSVSALQKIMQSAQAAMAAAPVMGHQSKHFWQVQDNTLSELEEFSKSWFKRRHAATQSALESCREISEQVTNDPAAAVTRWSEWQSQSVKRLAEDAQAFSEMMTKCIGNTVSNEIEAAEESAETTKRAMKQAASKPV